MMSWWVLMLQKPRYWRWCKWYSALKENFDWRVLHLEAKSTWEVPEKAAALFVTESQLGITKKTSTNSDFWLPTSSTGTDIWFEFLALDLSKTSNSRNSLTSRMCGKKIHETLKHQLPPGNNRSLRDLLRSSRPLLGPLLVGLVISIATSLPEVASLGLGGTLNSKPPAEDFMKCLDEVKWAVCENSVKCQCQCLSTSCRIESVILDSYVQGPKQIQAVG